MVGLDGSLYQEPRNSASFVRIVIVLIAIGWEGRSKKIS
jgi:hypothetical protein